MITIIPLWLWRASRKAIVIILAYLIQTTVLPYFKLGGVMPDLMLGSLVAISASMANPEHRVPWRVLIGATIGLAVALILEVSRKEPQGLTTVICVLAGAAACLLPPTIERRLQPGRFSQRRRARIMNILPCLMIGAAALIKETLMVIYFYLRGVNIGMIHVGRVMLAMALNLGLGLAGYHLLIRWVYAMPADTWIAKANQRRIASRRRRVLRGISKKEARRPAMEPGMEGGLHLPTASPLPGMRIKAKPILDEDIE